MDAQQHEATRLENLWSGQFGEAYVERNANVADGRDVFWADLLGRHPVSSVLEIGCNVGGNLVHIGQHVAPSNVVGVDVNATALNRLRQSAPDLNAIWSRGRDLPFRDRRFDLVLTVGVLIHQPTATLPLVMSEAVRCSSRYVLCAEYESEEEIEVPYRDQEGALFKRPYGRLYQELFDDLERIDGGFLSRADTPFDDVTWHLFRRRDAHQGPVR